MGSTPIYGLPYPELTDPADVPLHIRNHALGTEGVLDGFADQIVGSVGAVGLLGHTKLAANTAAIDFASIPQTWQHLLVLAHFRSAVSGGAEYDIVMRLNQVATASYYSSQITGVNNAVAGLAKLAPTFASIGMMPGASAAAWYPGGLMLLIPNYTDPDIARHWLSLSYAMVTTAAAGQFVRVTGGQFTGYAVNHLRLFGAGGDLAAKSVATLYGLKGA